MVSLALATFIFLKWLQFLDAINFFVLNAWLCYSFLNTLNAHFLELATTLGRLGNFCVECLVWLCFSQHSQSLSSGNCDDSGTPLRLLSAWLCSGLFNTVRAQFLDNATSLVRVYDFGVECLVLLWSSNR